MTDTIFRETWAEVNLEAIGQNINQIKQKLPNHTGVIAVVKANAYGHGDVQIARKALDSGAKMLAVALLEEALRLREANIQVPILVFGRVSPKDAVVAAEHDITLTFFQKDWIREVKRYYFHKPLRLHMKWDTGMGRIGLRTDEELMELLTELKNAEHVKLTGVYTHFATADEVHLDYFHEQFSRFEKLLHTFDTHWDEPVAIHIGNSAASIRFPEKMQQFIRFGIAMYGLHPSHVTKDASLIKLRPAFSLHSRLIHVKQVEAGESISYGATYTTSEKAWIGTIPIGYADGWVRKLQGFKVLINGRRMPIAGRICMDQTMILLDGEYPVGTKVTLIGKQGDQVIEADDVARTLDTINYEIPCMITSRVPRIYT